MTSERIYCFTAVSARGVVTLTNHFGRFRMFSHVSALERRQYAKSCTAAPARSEARTAAAVQRAATPPLSNTGINGGAA
jgi:hypothetical protein